MSAFYDYGQAVRVIRNVRNDGTFPGLDTGAHLVRRGSVGYVQNVGTFLQDQIVYSVHFLDENRVVGCRQEELIDAAAEWLPSEFEFRDKVSPKRQLAINGEIVAKPGDAGEVLKVLRQQPIAYHVRFNGRTLQIPEQALRLIDGDGGDTNDC